MPNTSADLIIKPKWVVPVEPHGTVLENHALVIGGEEILDILPQSALPDEYQQVKQVDLPDHVIMPGLINAHGHAAMTLLRGYADDRPLMDWLNDHIWPVEAKHVSEDFVYDGTSLAIAEMISTGTTCAVDTYFFPDAVARAFVDNHMRAQICMPIVQFANAWAENENEHISKALKVFDQFKNQELLTLALAPHAPYSVSDDAFARIKMYAEQLDIPVHLHLHETESEVLDGIRLNGQRPFARMSELGLLSPNLQAIHMTELVEEEISQMAAAGVHVAHCAESNMKLASGFCRVGDLLQAGVNVALGTDGAASNNNLDMLEETRSAALLAKAVARDATVMDAHQALAMATINGARMLGIDDITGSLLPGKRADLIAVDLSAINFQPIHDPVSQIIYTATGHQVSDVWINGRQVYEAGQLILLDEEKLRARVDSWRNRIHS